MDVLTYRNAYLMAQRYVCSCESKSSRAMCWPSSVKPERRKNPLTLCFASRNHGTLLNEIQTSVSSQDLLRILSDNEEYILSGDTTTYLTGAWDVLLHKHSSTIKGNRDLQGFMMEHTMPIVSNFKPPEISMIARAMVATRTGAAADIVQISSNIQTRMVQFAPKELCMVLWALSSHPGMNEKEKHSLFKSLASLVKGGMGMDNFTAQDLSILVWSLGHVGFRNDTLLEAAEMESLVKIESFTTEDISRLMHGFSCVGYNPYSLFASVTQNYQDRLEEFSAQDLALFLVSLGRLVVEPPAPFCKSIISRAKDLVPPVTAKARTQVADAGMLTVHLNALILWSFARLGLKKSSFTSRSLRYITANIPKHDLEDFVAVLWACCRLELRIDIIDVAGFSSHLLGFFTNHEHGNNNTESLCRGFRYLCFLWGNAVIPGEQGQGRNDNGSTLLEQNVESIITELFGKAIFLDNVSNWERTSVIIALGGCSFLFESKNITRLNATIIRSIQRRIISLEVEASLIPKLTFTIAKLHLDCPSVIERMSKTIIYKCGVISLDGLVQISYAFASFPSYNGKKQDVSNAIATRIVSNLSSLSSKDKARAAFSFYRMGKQQHVSRKILESMNEKDISGLGPTSLYGVFVALPACSSKIGADFRNALISAALHSVNSFTAAQLLSIQKILVDTRGTALSDQETNLDNLIRARTALG